jgi:signal transduction histidine kinase
LWFATSGHLVSIDPARVTDDKTSLQVLLQDVLVNGSVVRTGSHSPLTIEGRHLQNLEFDYIAVDLRSPGRVSYQYMLDGQDPDWQDVGSRRQAYYTNLPPGSYRFRVRAANGTGPWNELQAGVPFTVSPAFYQTKVFFVFCMFAAVGLTWVIYRWRLHEIADQMDAQFEARLSERTRIAQELHDTLLQGVLSASMQLHVANDQLEPAARAKPLLERVLELLGRVVEDGRNAVTGLRVSSEHTRDLAEVFSRIPAEIAAATTVEFRVLEEGTPRSVHPLIRDEIYRIGREAVTNAFRHSHAKAIEVAVDYDVDELRLQVRDNGCGMDVKTLQSGRDGHWGLSGMRERAEKIGGSLKLWSSAESGTEVDLRVPARIAFESRSRNGNFKFKSAYAKARQKIVHDGERNTG